MKTTDWLIIAAIVAAGGYAWFQWQKAHEKTDETDDPRSDPRHEDYDPLIPSSLPADVIFSNNVAGLAEAILQLDYRDAITHVGGITKTLGETITGSPLMQDIAQFPADAYDAVQGFMQAVFYGEPVYVRRNTGESGGTSLHGSGPSINAT